MKIAIDAGHGPETPGKRTPDESMREFEFNSAAAQYLADVLVNDYADVQVQFMHEANRDVPLSERTKRANSWGADLYVSIHANAYGSSWNDARGIETYVYTTKPPEAVRLANAVQRKLIEATGLVNRGVKSADFHVLRETNMTAILIECGFMSNRAEAELLKSDDYRRTCARAIAAGIAETYQLARKPAPSDGGSQQGQTALFRDVPPGHWAEAYIAAVRNSGIMVGYGDGTFRPDRPVTRAELAKVLNDILYLIQSK
jgi:N-acetylmuramoyl-L-alanine amidase